MTEPQTIPADTAPTDRLVSRNGRALDPKVGFDLGWDIASYGLRLPVLPNDALLSGYEEASTRRAAKPLAHDRFVRKWLQLRVNAWLRHRVVDEEVTPAFLQKIDVAVCPITRLALTAGTGEDSDWSVDRINNEGAYAVGNLAVMSSLANKAKGRKSFAQVFAHAAADGDDAEGLTRIQWMRMAAAMVVPSHLVDARMPLIPYPLRPLPEVPLSFDQSLQWVLVNECYGGKKTIVGRLKDACNTPARQRKFHQLIQKVRRKAEKLGQNFVDVWNSPELWAVFEEFMRTMDPKEFDRFTALMSPGKSPKGEELLASWRLENRGYMPGYCPPDNAAVEQGVSEEVDAAADDEVSQALEAMAELPDVEDDIVEFRD